MSKTGSEMKYGNADPRVCCLCQQPIRLTTNETGAWFHHEGSLHLALHVGCGTLRDALATMRGPP